MVRILVTRRIPGQAMEELKKTCEVEVYEGEGKMPRGMLLKKVKGVEAILSMLTEKIDGEVLKAAGPQLKIIANYAVGFDNVDVEEVRRLGIWVTNTPGRLGDAVAEFTVALVMALARMILPADRFMREGRYKVWDPNIFLGLDLTGKTLGIVGPGRIGSVVGKRLKAVFEMKVVYYCRHRCEEFEQMTGARQVSLEELLREADVVSLHVPLTQETWHMIGASELRMMKPTAILINTARGPVVEEGGLRRALEERWIWGAALDVFEEEVSEEQSHLDTGDWQALKNLDNVILTPHMASATVEAREEMTQMAVESIVAALSGKKPKYLVEVP